jgi:hypothetical protein
MEFIFTDEEQEMIINLIDKERNKKGLNENYLYFLRHEVLLNRMYRKSELLEIREIIKKTEKLVNSSHELDIMATMFLFEIREKINEHLFFLEHGRRIR